MGASTNTGYTRIAMFAAGTATIVLLVWGLYIAYIQSEVVFFREALRSARSTETIQVGGIVYRLSDGVMYEGDTEIVGSDSLPLLRIAYAKTVARHSPLISISGTDPALLDGATERLEAVRDNVSLLQKTQSDADSVRSGLYPIDFLRALADVERKRIDFLAQGTPEQEEAYAQSQRYAVTAYYSDLKKYRKAFEKTVPLSIGRYGTARDVIGRNDIISATRALEASMYTTEGRLRNRGLCIGGVHWRCNISDIHPRTTLVPIEKAISTDYLSRSQEIESLFQSAYAKEASDSVKIYELSESACTGTIDGASLFAIYAGSPSGIFSEVSPVYIGNIRFTDAARERATPFYDYFFTQGVRYVVDDPLLHYKCLEAGQDIGKLLSLRSLHTFAQQAMLSIFESGASKISLEKIEKAKGTVTDPITYADATRYINAAVSLMINKKIPEKVRSDVFNEIITFTNSSASFDAIVRTIAQVEESNMALSKKGVRISLDAPYLFYVRSAFTTLFLSNNPSVVGQPKQYFPENTLPKSAEPFVYYSSLKEQGLGSTLQHDLNFFIRIHNKPSVAPTYIAP